MKMTLKEYLKSPESEFALFMSEYMADYDFSPEMHMQIQEAFNEEDLDEEDWEYFSMKVRSWLQYLKS